MKNAIHEQLRTVADNIEHFWAQFAHSHQLSDLNGDLKALARKDADALRASADELEKNKCPRP